MSKRAVVLLSGGLDSSTLAFYKAKQNYFLSLVSFNYGQRHSRELEGARSIAAALGASLEPDQESLNGTTWDIVDMHTLNQVLDGSALTDVAVQVPDGHYAADNMKATVVPNRNAILLSIAYGIAVARHADQVCAAVHSGDHQIYPDCRPEFILALQYALGLGNKWATPIPTIETPFIHYDKSFIALLAKKLSVPIEATYSCYKGGQKHCGLCGTCVERREAMFMAGVGDPTEYYAPLEETERVGGVILHH
jgi:7-cyano-7-deazaguanine synthase